MTTTVVPVPASSTGLAEVIVSCWGLHDAAVLTLGSAHRVALLDFAAELERLESQVDAGVPADELLGPLASALQRAIEISQGGPP